MAEDTRTTKLNFEFWLQKALEWGQITTSESQQDVCLHLPELQEFLLQIYGALKHMVIREFPLIGQLLGRLCWNPFVTGYDECQKILMWCLCCLYSGEPQSPVELKANSWIQVVLSLVTELSQNPFNGFNSQQSTSSRVTSVSLLCVPLITLPDVMPLLEALLRYHEDGSEEVLHSEFLEAVNEAILQKKISLSESAVLQLWLRHLPSLEKAVLQNIENLICSQLTSVQEMACLIKQSLLHQAACHPVIFRTADEIFKNALLETDGASEVMTVMQVFTQCFVQAYHENNKQHKFPLKAYFPNNPHSLVMAFLKHPSGKNTYEVSLCCSRSCSDLFENWFLFLHFGEWVDVAAEELLVSQAESSDALLWLLAFYYNPSDENQQRTQTMVEVRSVCDHLRILSRKPAVSITDLQTIVTGKMNIRQEGIKHLVMHLIISFLLFIPGGHAIAKEFTVHVSTFSFVLLGAKCLLQIRCGTVN
uniref:FA complementation group C n=1 Tax=Varanus komodoensis TaxID=61221 RepID=A0A8D2JBV8_VARKO